MHKSKLLFTILNFKESKFGVICNSKQMREAVSGESIKSSHSRQAAETLDENHLALMRPQEPINNSLTANDEIIAQLEFRTE